MSFFCQRSDPPSLTPVMKEKLPNVFRFRVFNRQNSLTSVTNTQVEAELGSQSNSARGNATQVRCSRPYVH